ncbi:Putative auto-transporter adhesin, head GIN domain [Chryseobacterium polytrichastri]|uniref:Putative auto-transporter adhesin, head GIN domain n=2 Tax=Chryseobacterium polytrichastri TaxID=1302687 RepID=A0A1M7CZH1_9FLAO|nr:Putative auto-transporter adhesin, head GIN domain [Chryseobacterium polytrichastri]
MVLLQLYTEYLKVRMKKVLFTLMLIVVVSCGKISPKGKIETKDIDVSEFVNLDLEGKFRVFYARGPKNFVEIETYPNVAKNLDVDVKDKTLSIKESRGTKGVDFYNVTIYSKYNLEKVSISDSVEMNISSEIKTDNFRLNLKNNATFMGSINTRRAEVEMKNGSRANFLGLTKDAVIKISDTASLIAPYWKITNLKIDSKNGNYAEVNVKDSLKGNIQNTAKFIYYNNPIRAFKIDKTTKVENKKLD